MSFGPHGSKILSSDEVAELVDRCMTATATTVEPLASVAEISPDSIHAPHVPQGTTAEASSLARIWNNTFDPYNRTQLRDLYMYDEPSFYQDYEESYKTNPFTFMLVEYMVTTVLGDGFHFEGPGDNVVENFFRKDETRSKLEMWYRDSVRFGNGMMDFSEKNDRLVGTRNLNPFDILVTVDREIMINGAQNPNYGKRLYWQTNRQLDGNYIMHGVIKQLTGGAYGMSPLRPNIVFLQALLDCGGDVLSAIKRVGYAPIVARLDLDGYRTEAEKRNAVTAFENSMKDTESAVNNFVIDRRNDLNLLGTGSAGARLLPVNDLLEPWIAVALRNFGMPIGIFLQQGANKAIVDAQREDVRVVFTALRERFKFDVDNHLLPRITSRETSLVWNKPPPSSPETQSAFKLYLLAFQLGLISKEFILDYFDIEDTGKEFYEGNPTQGASHDLGGKAPSPGAE